VSPGLSSLGGVASLPAGAVVKTLQGAVEPLGRLAGRVPGQKKG
jgi:hypothetical protein